MTLQSVGFHGDCHHKHYRRFIKAWKWLLEVEARGFVHDCKQQDQHTGSDLRVRLPQATSTNYALMSHTAEVYVGQLELLRAMSVPH